MDSVDCVVVGAGVVGLAVARSLALAGREVLVLEAEDAIGTHTSSRNSEVIHAGIYYRADSLMARLCVGGNAMLYRYCAERGVAHRRCGKLIVATDEEEAGRLGQIQARAEANGVPELRRLGQAEAVALEPNLRCVAALSSGSTGIIDSHGYMLALQGELEDAGGTVALRARLDSATVGEDGIALSVGGEEPLHLRARSVVNAAGLHAPSLARRMAGLPREAVPGEYYAKGNYFTLAGRAPFSRLIYPVPVPGGLGVHLTIDLGGQARFGPDVEWVESVEYSVDPRRSEVFYDAVRRYWPGLRDGALSPAYAGIRPKTVPQGAPAQDFGVEGPRQHGVPGLVNMFGIESPGLTASLALGEHVRALLDAA